MLHGIIVYPFCALIAVVVGWRTVRDGSSAFLVAMRVLFVLYLGWVAGSTLFPLPVHRALIDIEAAGQGVSVNLIPLHVIRQTLDSGSLFLDAWLIGGNILTLAPFGFLLPFTVPGWATWRRMALAALLFPLAIELSQLGVSLLLGYSYRSTDVDDVLLNFAGILFGFAWYRAYARYEPRHGSAADDPSGRIRPA